jgi:hypothetical protein
MVEMMPASIDLADFSGDAIAGVWGWVLLQPWGKWVIDPIALV